MANNYTPQSKGLINKYTNYQSPVTNLAKKFELKIQISPTKKRKGENNQRCHKKKMYLFKINFRYLKSVV